MFISLLNNCISSRQADCLYSYQSLYMMHHFCSGRNANLLNCRLDSSLLVQRLVFFLLMSMLMCGSTMNVKGVEHVGCMSAQLSEKRKQIKDFNYLSSKRIFTFFTPFPLCVHLLKRNNTRLNTARLLLCRLCTEGG